MVCYEAAKSICALPYEIVGDKQSSVIPLQLLLLMDKPIMKFCGIKALSEISLTHPEIVMSCNDEIESLINDSNKGIATLSIITLLCTSPMTQVRVVDRIS